MNQERTEWRDLGISKRHRQWGVTCTATDLDFTLIEYNYWTPLALIEYKHERTPPMYESDGNIRVISKLGTMAGIPSFACRYAEDYSWFFVVSLNKEAKAVLPNRTKMNEKEYVEFLMKLRKS